MAENGNIAWIKYIIAGLLIITIAILGFISTNKASVDRVDGLERLVESNTSRFIRLEDKVDKILIYTRPKP